MVNLTGGVLNKHRTQRLAKPMACVQATKAALAKLVQSNVIPPESVRWFPLCRSAPGCTRDLCRSLSINVHPFCKTWLHTTYRNTHTHICIFAGIYMFIHICLYVEIIHTYMYATVYICKYTSTKHCSEICDIYIRTRTHPWKRIRTKHTNRHILMHNLNIQLDIPTQTHKHTQI